MAVYLWIIFLCANFPPFCLTLCRHMNIVFMTVTINSWGKNNLQNMSPSLGTWFHVFISCIYTCIYFYGHLQYIWENISNKSQDIFQRNRHFTYYNVTMPMVVVLLVKSKSMLLYEIADFGLQLNIITYCYKKFMKTSAII